MFSRSNKAHFHCRKAKNDISGENKEHFFSCRVANISPAKITISKIPVQKYD